MVLAPAARSCLFSLVLASCTPESATSAALIGEGRCAGTEGYDVLSSTVPDPPVAGELSDFTLTVCRDGEPVEGRQERGPLEAVDRRVRAGHVDVVDGDLANPDPGAFGANHELAREQVPVHETRARDLDQRRKIKPIAGSVPIGYVAGLTAPKGRRMGHAGAIISAFGDTAAEKAEIMRSLGLMVAPSPAELGTTVAKAMAAHSKKPTVKV